MIFRNLIKGRVQSVQKNTSPSVSSGRITRASQVVVVSNITCADFEFNASVCHSSIEIYGDKKVMQSKQVTKETAIYKTIESGRLINYRGTLGTKPLNRHDQSYFEVAIQFRVLKLIRQTLVFEIGVSKLEFVDQHYTIDCHPYAWSVSARGCHICGKVCLQTWHNSQLLSHNAISPRTPTPANTVIRLQYGFLLDVPRRHLIVIDVKNSKMVFKFTNLVISEYSDPLWPVFGIYNPEQVLVSLQLLSGKDINSIPIEAIEALSR